MFETLYRNSHGKGSLNPGVVLGKTSVDYKLLYFNSNVYMCQLRVISYFIGSATSGK